MSTKNEIEIFEIVVDNDIIGPLSGRFESFELANEAAMQASRTTSNITLTIFLNDSPQEIYTWHNGDWD
jgi:hypothetical protein